jgi:pimeloyl-ACP methyl ester carboxylesterase
VTLMPVTSPPADLLHIDDGGTGGVPVLFIHSFSGTAEHWTRQLDHLRTRRRAAAFDSRGHGESTAPPDDDYSIESLVEDIDGIAHALGLDRFVLVGHSMGGTAAAAYAGAHPKRLAGIVLAETPGRSSPEQSKQILSALEKDFDRTMDSYWKKLLTNARPDVSLRIDRGRRRMRRSAAMSILRTIFAFDPIPPLSRFDGPKLAITTSAPNPQALHHQARGVDHEVIDGTSHWMQMDKPDAFNRILDAFLDRVDAEERQRSQARQPVGAHV